MTPHDDIIEVVTTPTAVVDVVGDPPIVVEVVTPATNIVEIAMGPVGPMRPDVVTSPDQSILTVKAMTQTEFDATAPHPTTQLSIII